MPERRYCLTFRKQGVTDPISMTAAHAVSWATGKDLIFDIPATGKTMSEAIRSVIPRLPGYEFEDGWVIEAVRA